MTGNNKKRSIFFFTFTTSMLWFSLYAYVAELSTYAINLGATYRMIGLITGSYGLTQLILRIPLGIISDILNKRKIFIIMGLVISAISSLITFLHPSSMSLIITRALAGVSASTWVLFTVMFSSYFKKEETTKAMGIMSSYNAIGQLSGMILGGIVSYFLGTKYLFLLAAIGATIGVFTSIFIFEEKIEVKKKKLQDFIDVIKHRQLQVVSILAIISQLMTFATVYGFVPIIAKNIGAKNVQLSILIALGTFPGIFVSRLAGSFFPKHLGRKNTIYIGFLISALLCIILPWVTSLKVLYAIQIFIGVGRSMVFTLLLGLGIEHIDQSKRATAMGIFQAIYGIGMVFGPILLGFIAQSYGLTLGFTITGFIGFIGLLITFKFVKES